MGRLRQRGVFGGNAYDARMPKNLYIIDGHAQIYRAYYAPFRRLTSPTGEPTHATHVFFQMLLGLLRDRQPDYVVMTLDADERKLLRKRLYPDYKAQREAPPEDLRPQEKRIISVLEAAEVPILRVEGYEADDIIATLVRRLCDEDLRIHIVSRDKDLEQLLSDRVSLYDPGKDDTITPERLFETKGWRPEQAIDAQVLTGDTVDNVPGVAGIGPKTAAKLLGKYGSARAVVDHADELPPKQRDNVLAFAPKMELTRQLVTLDGDVPFDFDLAQAHRERFDWSRAHPIFAELGFHRLLEQLPGGDELASPQTAPVTDVGGEPAPAAAKLREPEGGDYELVNTSQQLAAFAAQLGAQDEFALDTETTGVSAIDCDLVGLCFSWKPGRGAYLPVRSVYGNTLALDELRQRIGPILADPSKRKIGQNLKYDLNVLRNAGLAVDGPLFDTMIAAFVVDPMRGSYKLDRLVEYYLGHQMIPITDLIGKKGKQQLRMDQLPVEHVRDYAAEDADYTWRLKELLEPRLKPLGLERLFYETEMPLVSVLTDMEFNGIQVDVELLRSIGQEMASRAAAIVDEVHARAGKVFNLDSPKQLAEVLFDKLGFRVVRKTKTSRSTDAETLEVLERETGDPVFRLLLEYRETQKLRGTYVDALPGQLSRRTGRIHTSYHQTGAVTGRLSSSEPNLQNIPIRTEAGRQIRRAFVPRSRDELLVVADYSQVELRILAHLCEDEGLLRAFREDQDIHAFVAAEINGVDLADVTREMRGRAKAVNFGIVYGQTAFGLAQTTGLSRSDAQAFIDTYFARYPRIRAFIDQCCEAARREGLVRTVLGRRRPIENISSRNANARAQAERLAVNTVVQGSAADLIKIAMIQLQRRIAADGLPLRMLLQVHDELVCETPREKAESMAGILRDVMTGAMDLRIPLKVDVACGENWLEAK